MRTHASRSAVLLTALGIALAAPRAASAATPTCEFGGNPELGSYTMTCSYLNMPRYSQIDPNLAYIRAPQVVLDYEANQGYAGIFADWPNVAGPGGTALASYGTSAGANDDVANNDVAGGTIQVHSWGAFSQSWLRSGPGADGPGNTVAGRASVCPSEPDAAAGAGAVTATAVGTKVGTTPRHPMPAGAPALPWSGSRRVKPTVAERLDVGVPVSRAKA